MCELGGGFAEIFESSKVALLVLTETGAFTVELKLFLGVGVGQIEDDALAAGAAMDEANAVSGLEPFERELVDEFATDGTAVHRIVAAELENSAGDEKAGVGLVKVRDVHVELGAAAV